MSVNVAVITPTAQLIWGDNFEDNVYPAITDGPGWNAADADSNYEGGGNLRFHTSLTSTTQQVASQLVPFVPGSIIEIDVTGTTDIGGDEGTPEGTPFGFTSAQNSGWFGMTGQLRMNTYHTPGLMAYTFNMGSNMVNEYYDAMGIEATVVNGNTKARLVMMDTGALYYLQSTLLVSGMTPGDSLWMPVMGTWDTWNSTGGYVQMIGYDWAFDVDYVKLFQVSPWVHSAQPEPLILTTNVTADQDYTAPAEVMAYAQWTHVAGERMLFEINRTDSANFIRAGITSDSDFGLWEVTAGTPTAINSSAGTLTNGNDYLLKVWANNSHYLCEIMDSGKLISFYTDATSDATRPSATDLAMDFDSAAMEPNYMRVYGPWEPNFVAPEIPAGTYGPYGSTYEGQWHKYDQFNGTDGDPFDTSTDGHVPDKGDKGDWTQWNGGWIINTNTAICDSGGGGQEVLALNLGTDVINYEATWSLDLDSDGADAGIVWGSASDDYWLFNFGGTPAGVPNLFHFNGSFNQFEDFSSDNDITTTDHTVVLRVENNLRTVTVDDTEVMSLPHGEANGPFVGLRVHTSVEGVSGTRVNSISVINLGDTWSDYVLYDDFTGTDGDKLDTSSGSHAPNKGGAWLTHFGNLEITSSNDVDDSGGAGGHATLESNLADGYVYAEGIAAGGGAAEGGVSFRYSDSDNYWWAGWDILWQTLRVIKYVAGTPTNVSTELNSAHTIANGDTFKIEVILHGDSMDFIYNDTLSGFYADTHNETATRHGLFSNQSGGAPSWDLFYMTTDAST